LKLNCDKPLSNVAFTVKLRPYNEDAAALRVERRNEWRDSTQEDRDAADEAEEGC
jgi:hypothetical protein